MNISRFLLFFFFFLFSINIISQVRVEGYYRKDGTCVQPHYRSSPNSTKLDNYSSKGNVNPYTGVEGTKKIEDDFIYIPNTIDLNKSFSDVLTPDQRAGFKHFSLGDDIRLDKYSDKLNRTHLDGLLSEYIYTGSDVCSLFDYIIDGIFFTFNITSLCKIVVYFEEDSYSGLYLGLSDVFGYANFVKKDADYAVWDGEKVEITLMESSLKKTKLTIVDKIQRRKLMQNDF